MSIWKELTVGDVCSTVSDTYQRNDKEVVLVNTSDVLEGKVLNHQSVENKNLKGQFKKTFKKNDILYSEIRPANKRYAYVDFNETERYIASTKLMVLRPKTEIILPRFLLAYLSLDHILAELQHLAETRSGTFPQITFSSELAPLQIAVPDLGTQGKIIEILDVIEKKIKNNNEINDNLQQQVSSIYQAWFEDFALFQGSCPKSWEYGTLSDIADISSGKRPPMKSAIRTANVSIPLVGAASVMGFTNEANHADKILVTGRVGTHGVIQRFHYPCWASDNTLVITSRYYEFTHQILQRIDYSSMNRGSTQPLITQGDMNKVAVLIPNDNILAEFEAIAGTLMLQYEANIIENTKLAEIRDALLPKLMSGEIDVSSICL